MQIVKQRSAPAKIEEGFVELIRRLTPSYSEPDGAEANLHAIEQRLTDTHDVFYMAPYGSMGHGTNIEGESAVDCFAVVPKSRVYEDSCKTMEEIRGSLEPLFPDACLTEGRPVIQIAFGERRSDCHHIVPAYPAGERNSHDVFGIPGPSNRWIEACPGAHSAWINELDEQSGHRLKNLARLAKAWNYANGAPLWSFYLEIAAADFLSKEGAGRTYAGDMQDFFTYLLRRRLDAFKNTEGSNEPVYGTCLDDKFDAMSPVRSAAEKAKKACFCERQNNAADAYFWWRKLFNYRFPPY